MEQELLERIDLLKKIEETKLFPSVISNIIYEYSVGFFCSDKNCNGIGDVEYDGFWGKTTTRCMNCE